MAEQDNVDIARKLYEHWNAREFDRVAELMAEDGEIFIVDENGHWSKSTGEPAARPPGRLRTPIVNNAVRRGWPSMRRRSIPKVDCPRLSDCGERLPCSTRT